MTGTAKGILFDFDGVIVHSEEHHRLAFAAALTSFGITLDRADYYRDYIGLDDRTCFVRAFAAHGIADEGSRLVEALSRKADQYLEAIGTQVTLVPGVEEFIRAAAAMNIRCAVVSGARRREIELVLNRTRLAPYFRFVIAAEDVAQTKPDPSGYRRAVQELGLTGPDCVAIEDSRPGLAAARAAGLRCIMLCTSHPAAHLADADLIWSDFVDHHPGELPWAAS